MLYVQPADPPIISAQLNVQVPWEIVPAGTPANVNVIVSSNGVDVRSGAGPSRTLLARRVLVQRLGHRRQHRMERSPGRPARFPDLTTHPAKIGDIMIVYANGMGAVASPPADGANSQR